MKISDFRKNNYDYSSQKASEVTRQLAFAGIALVWIFKLGGENPKIPGELIAPTFCFALTLAFDLLHYVIATILWGRFCRQHEKMGEISGEINPDVIAPAWINRPAIAFFTLKVLSVSIGYFFMFRYMSKILFC